MKDKYAITEIRKQANRMTFGSVCLVNTAWGNIVLNRKCLIGLTTPNSCDNVLAVRQWAVMGCTMQFLLYCKNCLGTRPCFPQIQEDAYQDDLGFNTGQLGKSGASGSVRAPTADKKTQVSISKRLQVCM